MFNPWHTALRSTLSTLVLAAAFCAGGQAQAQEGPFAGLDLNDDGIIEFEEARQQRRDVFASLDQDDDGFLSPEEAADAPSSARRRPGQTRSGMAAQMFSHADKDKDGLISEDEYADAMTPLLSRIDTNGDERVDQIELEALRTQIAAARRG